MEEGDGGEEAGAAEGLRFEVAGTIRGGWEVGPLRGVEKRFMIPRYVYVTVCSIQGN